MDVKYLIFVFVTIFYSNLSEVQCVSSPDTVAGTFELESKGENGKCKTKISTCKIRTGDIPVLSKQGDKGEKGDRGDSGIPGLDGIPGEKGDMGLPGLDGSQGIKGDRGEPGEAGPQGPPGHVGLSGIMGQKGDRGDQGISGLPGLQGLPGTKGEQGFPGMRGPPGISGTPGVCPCFVPDDTFITDELVDDNTPLNTTCKSASVNSGTYNFTYPRTFEAYCNMSTKMTCLKENAPVGDIPPSDRYLRPKNVKDISWLSQMNAFNLKELYGLERDQILWLQQQSTSVKQTLRIHTRNLLPYDKIGDNHIHLLTWNEKIIGPKPTRETPFFYSVVEDVSTCSFSTKTSEWCSTDIRLVSDASNRLPIIDIRLNEITNNEMQYIYVEHKELCFG